MRESSEGSDDAIDTVNVLDVARGVVGVNVAQLVQAHATLHCRSCMEIETRLTNNGAISVSGSKFRGQYKKAIITHKR